MLKGHMRFFVVCCVCILIFSLTGVQAESDKYADPQRKIVLSFVGDCNFGDAYYRMDESDSLKNVISEHGDEWLFSGVKDIFLGDDATFMNLEAIWTNRTYQMASKNNNIIGSKTYVNQLIKNGIDAVNTATNHCMDFGQIGYDDMMDVLDQAGITHFGTITGKTDVLAVYETKGIRIGALGYSLPQDYDIPKIRGRIRQLREMGCDLVIVSLHWGTQAKNGDMKATALESWQTGYAKEVIDAGADVIWGHHPGVLQPIMIYKGKPVFFSTGTFVSGIMTDVIRYTGVFQLQYVMDENGAPVLESLQVIPCITGERGDYRVSVLEDEAERENCLSMLIGKKDIAEMQNLPDEFITDGNFMFSFMSNNEENIITED